MLPKMGVGALIFDGERRVLLQFRMEADFYSNCWFLPCGKAEEGEGPEDAIIREVKEETSLDVEVVEELYNKSNERGISEIAYLCRIVHGVPMNLEPRNFREIKYFKLDDLPQDVGEKTLEIINIYKKSHSTP